MKITDNTIIFESGVTINFDDTFDKLKAKIKDVEELDVDDNKYISFESDDMVGDYLVDTTFYYYQGKLSEIELDFDLHAYAGKKFENYNEFTESNKSFLNELKVYVHEQFADKEVIADNDQAITVKVDDLLVSVTTGRGFEEVVMHIVSKDHPLIEH